jgi:hypothetical protein
VAIKSDMGWPDCICRYGGSGQIRVCGQPGVPGICPDRSDGSAPADYQRAGDVDKVKSKGEITLKKLIVLIVMVSLLSGCAAINSALNSDPVNYICAGEEGKLTAADMLSALETGMAIYSGGIAAVDIQTAVSVLTIIKKTGCFVVDQLKAVFAVVDAINGAKAQARFKTVRGKAFVKIPEYAPLRVYTK